MPIEWVIAGMGVIISTLSGAVIALWRDHLRRDAANEARIERLEGLVDVATDALSAQTAANAKGAIAQEETAKAVTALAADLRRERAARAKAGR